MSAIVSIALKETFLPDFPAEKPISIQSQTYMVVVLLYGSAQA